MKQKKMNGLPEGWKCVMLWEICELITDGTHQTPTYAENGYMFLSSKNIKEEQIDWINVRYIPEILHSQLYARIKPKLGDILLAKNGTTWVAWIVDRDVIFDIYVSLALLRPSTKILPAYLHRVVNSPIARHQFTEWLKGVWVPNLHLSVIRKTEIPLPPLSEQERIVAKLDGIFEHIDASIKLLERNIADADAMARSTLEKVFNNEALPNGWHKKTIEYLFKIKSGDFLPEKRMVPDWEYPVFWGNWENGRFDRFNIETDTLIIWRVWAKCWNIHYVKEKIWLTDNAFRITDIQEPLLLRYLELFLNFFDLWKTANKAAQPVISYKGIKDVEIPLPPLSEQERIVAKLDAFFSEQKAIKSKYETKISELKVLKSSILSEAFQGKI